MFELGGQRFEVVQRPVPHIIVDGLFGPELNRRLLDHVFELREHFKPAVIGATQEVVPEFRKNLICEPDAVFYDPDAPTDFAARIRSRAEKSVLLGAFDSLVLSGPLRDLLDTAPFPICKFREVNRWETQISRYGDPGDKYNWHLDRLGKDTRMMTFVYHFFVEPKPFEGGELELSDGLAYGGEIVSNAETTRIELVNDRAILFGARTAHRVLPTEAPEEFESGRFSVNVFCGRDGAVPGDRIY